MGDPSEPQELQEKIIKRDLIEFGRRRKTDYPYNDNLDVDVLIVGGGFSGTYLPI